MHLYLINLLVILILITIYFSQLFIKLHVPIAIERKYDDDIFKTNKIVKVRYVRKKKCYRFINLHSPLHFEYKNLKIILEILNGLSH